jgi:hypothetical protein
MNKRLILFAILAVCLLLLGWWFLRGNARHTTPNVAPAPVASSITTQPVVSNATAVPSSTVVTSKIVRMQTSLGPQSVRLFKSTNYPPQTTEEKALWEWWNAVDKADPDFQWKMPIEFYGKVVDQFDQPVIGAEVELNWTTVVGPIPDPKKSIFTGSDGRFEVTGIQGKGITISVYKEGYDRTYDWIQSFEYAAFFNNNFHVPDPNNPVLFHLHKLMGAEPMYKFLPYGDITAGGAPLILNVEKGKVAAQGDLAFSVVLGTETNRYGPDFIVTVQGLNGAICIFSDEEFLFKAPETGYQSTLSINAKIDDPKYSPFQKFRFYVKTGAGKYAAVEAKVNLWNNMAGASFSAIIYYNPSGSRNLEFDQNKWINR